MKHRGLLDELNHAQLDKPRNCLTGVRRVEPEIEQNSERGVTGKRAEKPALRSAQPKTLRDELTLTFAGAPIDRIIGK